MPAACSTARYSSLPAPMNRVAYAPCRVSTSSQSSAMTTPVARMASVEPHSDASWPTTRSRAANPARRPRTAAAASVITVRMRWSRCQERRP